MVLKTFRIPIKKKNSFYLKVEAAQQVLATMSSAINNPAEEISSITLLSKKLFSFGHK